MSACKREKVEHYDSQRGTAYLQGPNDRRDDAVIRLDLEGCENPGLSPCSVQSSFKFIRASCCQSPGDQVLSGGNNVVEDLSNVAIHIQPGTLHLRGKERAQGNSAKTQNSGPRAN